MHRHLLFCTLLYLVPISAGAQISGTTSIEKMVDSLLAVSNKLSNFKEVILIASAAKDSLLSHGGKGTIRYAKCAASLGIAYRKTGQFKDAEYYLTEAKELYERFDSRETVEYAGVLSHLGVVNAIAQRPVPAEEMMIQAKNTYERVVGKENLDYANATYNLALFYYNMGKYGNAEPLFLEAVELQEKVAGKENMNYALYLNGLANHFIGTGQFERAEPLSLEAKEIRSRILGKEHGDYVLSLASLGNLYRLMGQYKKAEVYYSEVRAIREKKLGRENLEYAKALSNLGTLYLQAGQYDKAEPFILEAKDIRAKKMGKENEDYATSLNRLAAFYEYTGQYDKAEQVYQEAISIYAQVLGKEHSTYALSLNNLGVLYTEMGEYAKAEPLCIEAKEVREKSFGKENPDYAASLMNLALLYKNMHQYTKAEMNYKEAEEIEARVLGKDHPDYAETLGNLANLYTETKQYEKAAPLYIECKRIQAAALGKRHPKYAKNIGSYARMLFASGRKPDAVDLEKEYLELEQQSLAQAAQYLSEQELTAYSKMFSTILANDLSYSRFYAEAPESLIDICYDNALFFKGFLLSSINRFRNKVLADADAATQYDLLGAYRRRLVAEYTKPVSERDTANITMLEAKANTLEKEMARTIAGFDQTFQQVKWQSIQTALKPGEAAVEFVHYYNTFPQQTDSIYYAALLIRPDAKHPLFIPLCEEKELSLLLRGASGGGNFMKINALYTQKAAGDKQQSLYSLIWQPLEGLLDGFNRVYCASSGLLHRINLAAVPDPQGQVLGDRYQLVELGSTRQMVVSNTELTTNVNSAYLAGGIRYDSDSTAIYFANRGTSTRSFESEVIAFQPDSASVTRGGVLEYLPATAAEVRDISQVLTAAGVRAKVDTGFYATEESFKTLGVGAPAPRIIHLATHGYFFPDPQTADGRRQPADGSAPVFKLSEHPMIRSGLIMAGAKQAWLGGKHPAGQEDGILTAYEISQMNLTGTELVVLSACETGLGDIVGNEGVYGLQRAFKIAGAKYLIMSLWKVDDRSTQEFMTTFYRHWLTGKLPIPQAFRQAQHDMRTKHPSPYDWAGFVLIE